MAQHIYLLGAQYLSVPEVDLPKVGGGTAKFMDVTDTTAEAADVANDKYFYTAAGVKTKGTGSGGGGGGDNLPLLSTTALGSISTTSTSQTSLGKTLTIQNINSYDFLVVIISADSPVNNRHVATFSVIALYSNNETISTKGNIVAVTSKTNVKLTSAGAAQSRAATTAYGIYPYNPSVSEGTVSIPLYIRYNSQNTGTINGNYTARVYGINAFGLS